MTDFSLERKRELCTRLSELPASSSQVKEIFNLIQDYIQQYSIVQPKRLGGGNSLPFGGHKNGDDYTFNMEQFPTPLIAMIERLLAVE